MASESTALSSHPAAAGQTEPSSRLERRAPSARETLATLPEAEAEPSDFEPHDTIPAPPWLDEPDDQISPPLESP